MLLLYGHGARGSRKVIGNMAIRFHCEKYATLINSNKGHRFWVACSFLAAARSNGNSAKPALCRSCSDKIHKLDREMNNDANDPAFHDNGWGTDCGVSKVTACSFKQTFTAET